MFLKIMQTDFVAKEIKDIKEKKSIFLNKFRKIIQTFSTKNEI